MAEYLLDHGADVDASIRGVTPFLWLIFNSAPCSMYNSEEHLPVAQLLLDRGADRDAIYPGGRDSIKIAAQSGLTIYIDILQLILDYDKYRPISIARLNEALLLSLGHSEAVKCLLDHGVQAEFLDRNGRTPLLILRGGYLDRNARGDNFYTHLLTIQALLEHGANTNALCPVSGDTALLFVSDRNVPSAHTLSTLLLQYGADLRAKCPLTGATPLIRVARNRQANLVKLYLEHGADVMQVNRSDGIRVDGR